MIKVVLFCSGGMSTSLLETKIKKSAKEKGIDISINSYAEAEMAERIKGADAVLLGPQVRYTFTRAKKLCGELDIPVEIIDSRDYGMMDGEKVLNQILRMVEKKKGGTKVE